MKKKLNKKQKVIIALAILGIIVGGYLFYINMSNENFITAEDGSLLPKSFYETNCFQLKDNRTACYMGEQTVSGGITEIDSIDID